MPTYRAEDSNGRVIELEGDHQPSDAEIAAEFAKLDTAGRPDFTSENAKDAAGNAEVQGGGRAAAFKALGDAWKHNGPDEVMAGLHDFFKAKGMDETAAAIHRGLSGAMVSSLPVTGPLAVAGALMAPIPTALAIGGGLLVGKSAEKGAEFVGAGPGVQSIAGDVGNIVGGGVASGLKFRPRLPGGGGGSAAGREAAEFMRARGVPVEASVASDNRFLKTAQELSDRTFGGSMVSTPANAVRDAAMKRVGGELAAEVSPVKATPEVAADAVRRNLATKEAGHNARATTAYDEIRALQDNPDYQMEVSLPPALVDKLSPTVRSELRQVFHELDAKGYERGKLVNDEVGSGSTYVRGSRGADVYHEIDAQLGTTAPTRGEVQSQIDAFLGGGKASRVTDAAIQVAKDRARLRMQGGGSISSPPGGNVPTPAEALRVPEKVGLPTNIGDIKPLLKPVYDRMARMMPVAQQQMSGPMQAIKNILDSRDWMPLSEAVDNFSAIREIANKEGGAARLAVSRLRQAIDAAAAPYPEVVDALGRGRAETIGKYKTQAVAQKTFGKALDREAVGAFTSVTAPRDGSIGQLRRLASQTPDQVPVMARAWLENTFDKPGSVAEWRKLGPETKKVLFPKTAESLDRFFNAMERIAQTNENKSKSGLTAAQAGEIGSFMTSIGMAIGAPHVGIPMLAGEVALEGTANIVSRLARSPAIVDRLTRVATLKAAKAPAPVMRAAVLQLTQALRAGATEGLPMAAESQDTPAGTPAGAGR